MVSLFVQFCTFLGNRLVNFHFFGERDRLCCIGLHLGTTCGPEMLIKDSGSVVMVDFLSFYFGYKHYILSKPFQNISEWSVWEEKCLLLSNVSFHPRDIQVFKMCKLATR